jgi:hypothetical protein
MAYADFDVYKSHAGMIVAVDVLSPVEGVSSLYLADNGVGGDPQAIAIRQDGGGYTRGLTQGRMRGLIKIISSPGASAGFTFLQSQVDITTSGDLYGIFVGRPRLSIDQLCLKKLVTNQGLQAPAIELLVLNYSPSTNVIALEVTWVVDLTTLGGTYIKVSASDPASSATDFSGLITRYEAVDYSSPLTTSAGESWSYHNAFGGTNSYYIDTCSVAQVTLT